MQDISSRVFYTIVGLVVGAVISSVTEYTGLGTKPVMAIVQKSSTGAGTVIAGLATGFLHTVCCCNLDLRACRME
jgi:K(+)-stimulated pyrophosphate-energized sodium pump